MTPQVKVIEVPGYLWLNDPDGIDSDAIIEMEDGRIVIERTDEDEIAIHWMPENDDAQALVSIYTNRTGAYMLIGALQMEAAKP